MNHKDRLITSVNRIVKLINEGKIKHQAIIELIEIIQENELKNSQWVEEVEANNMQLSYELNNKNNIEFLIRIQALGFTSFQFSTFDIKKAYKAQQEGKLSEFMREHKKTIKSFMKCSTK